MTDLNVKKHYVVNQAGHFFIVQNKAFDMLKLQDGCSELKSEEEMLEKAAEVTGMPLKMLKLLEPILITDTEYWDEGEMHDLQYMPCSIYEYISKMGQKTYIKK